MIHIEAKESDFIIEVKTDACTEHIRLRDALKIDDNRIASEFQNQASWYAWYSALHAHMEEKYAEAKRDLSRAKAQTELDLRTGKIVFNDATGKPMKLTEGGVAAYLETDKKLQTLQDEMDVIQAKIGKLDVLVGASEHRRDMLVSLGLHKRQEMKQTDDAS